jgi:alanine racemase
MTSAREGGSPPDGGVAPVAEVNLAALRRNVARLRARAAPGAAMLVAVKADAYGHGLLPVARALAAEGVGWFGVATPDEALALRRAGVPGRVLVFGPVRGPALARLLTADVDLSVAGDDDVTAVEAALPATGGAAASGSARLHLKIDTGMGRLGHRPDEALAVARRIAAHPRLELTGVWTHFACADEPSRDVTERQRTAFERALAALARDGIRPELRHAANSAALLTAPTTHYDLVRPGIAVYGYAPGPELTQVAAELEPVLRLTAPVVFVKRVRAGEAVSYGHRWTAPADTTVATVRFGYADGYARAFGNVGEATLAGRRCRVVGTVCMDQTMLDVGDAEVAVGDRAVMFGPGGPGADEAAARIGTIPYEPLTALGRRVVRRYRL